MLRNAVALVCAVLVAAEVQAEIVIETVTVGNPGNAGELSGECVPGGYGPCCECGAVDYSCQIGKYEVTAGQYTQFLNAAAATDTYGLYSTEMRDPWCGCNIQRGGSPGSYSYTVAGDWADRPVNHVSWGDAARFCNWLHNGQPMGAQDLSTTEDGSYYLNGATSNAALMAVVREEDATWVIPSEDEWYKAAYHCNDGVTGTYYDYPTSSDSVPSNDLIAPDPGNNANFLESGYTIGRPYWRTKVGDFENSESAYGTYDQGGNVFEWNETAIASLRGLRGGAYDSGDYDLHAAWRYYGGIFPTDEHCGIGFRVARVPERGDYDANGTVNLADYAVLPACLTGPDEGLEPRCDVFDFDFDVDVDLTDFAGFQRVCIPSPPGMVFIPAGEFEMGDPWSEGDDDERPVHTVYLSPYYVDKYEVTNDQYVAALNWAYSQGELITVTDGVVYLYGSGTSYAYCDTTTSSSYSRITWNGNTFGVVTGKENHPMVRVSWYGSVAFCNWRSAMEGKPLCYDLSTWVCNFAVAGYRLPKEAEWEKAARGGVAGRRFPWSDTDTIQHARANYYSLSSYSYDTSPTRSYHPTFRTGDFPYTSRVGYFAPNGYGVHDMAGNVWEWCNDWYSSSYYSSPPGSNPTGPGGGSYRVLRGGGWAINASYSRCAYRGASTPGYRYGRSGFRCALGAP